VKALARPCWWRRLLEEGQFGTLAELADAERISRSYVCRVLRLRLLAPDIVEQILDGRPGVGLAQLQQPFPVEWARQREELCAGARLRRPLAAFATTSGTRSPALDHSQQLNSIDHTEGRRPSIDDNPTNRDAPRHFPYAGERPVARL
jgi:hypothetical protein